LDARALDPADHPCRCDDSHVGTQAIAGPLVDRKRPEIRTRTAGNHRGGGGRELRLLAQLEQLLERPRLGRQGALLLQPHLQLSVLVTQPLVLLTYLLEGEVVLPAVLEPLDDGRRPALNLGKDAKGHRFQHRHTATGVDLGGDQDDVRDGDRDE
jgi:hypothetical protein